ncbi:MAG: hypothetical protein JSU63_13410 [Phycisphaerales bacterium]|nr:MAG: hypothetical protein JSU63_13410 [Phycisphaerales bacterium]
MTADEGHTHEGRHEAWRTVLQHRFAVLLCALALLLVGAPLVRMFRPYAQSRIADLVIPLLFAVVLLSAVLAVSRTRRTRTLALLLAIPAAILQVLQTWIARDGLAIAGHFLGILFLAYVIVLILKFLFVSGRVSSDMICASLCVYVLLGVLCALAYSVFYYLDPGAFVFSFAEEGEAETMRFGGERTFVAIYYSFVTMSTLGYGDIVPISSMARTCAALQAVVGQLYLAVLVARLVGLHISHSPAAGAGGMNAD